MDKIVLLGGRDGFGGLCKTMQCAHFVRQAGFLPEVFLSIKYESGELLKYLFDDKFSVTIVPEEWTQNDNILYNKNLLNEFTSKGDFYYVYPDELYRNPYAFDFKRFNVNPKTIHTTRLLTHRLKRENIIYLALNTTTQNYNYEHVEDLIKKLSVLPYTIYVPILDSWNSENVKVPKDLKGFPDNVIIDKNPNMIDSVKILEKSEFCICVDNGFSHLSYHLGQRRILLDSRFGSGMFGGIWKIRWMEDDSDNIPIYSQPQDILNLVKTFIVYPQNILSNNEIIKATNLNVNWNQSLMLKNY